MAEHIRPPDRIGNRIRGSFLPGYVCPVRIDLRDGHRQFLSGVFEDFAPQGGDDLVPLKHTGIEFFFGGQRRCHRFWEWVAVNGDDIHQVAIVLQKFIDPVQAMFILRVAVRVPGELGHLRPDQ